jgi:hypothetical protein
MNEETKAEIVKCRAWQHQLYAAGGQFASSMGPSIYMTDLLAIAALNRAMCLLRAFCDLIAGENFVAAAPLERLQLDTSLRLAALDLVDRPSEFAQAVFGGAQINQLTDRAGKKLTDHRLVKHLAEHHPWITNVYRETCGFVHFSDKHIFNALTSVSAADHNIQMKASDRDAFVPDAAYVEGLRTFGRLTDLVAVLVRAYALERNTG